MTINNVKKEPLTLKMSKNCHIANNSGSNFSAIFYNINLDIRFLIKFFVGLTIVQFVSNITIFKRVL